MTECHTFEEVSGKAVCWESTIWYEEEEAIVNGWLCHLGKFHHFSLWKCAAMLKCAFMACIGILTESYVDTFFFPGKEEKMRFGQIPRLNDAL